jgi:hypothetical protein
VALTLNNLGNVYDDEGMYPLAEQTFSRALAIEEKALGPAHPVVAGRLNNLGVVYKQEGKYQQAEQTDNRALAIEEKALGPEHPDVAQTLNNLGSLYMAQQDWVKAEHYYQRATDIVERRTAVGELGQPLAGKQQSEAVRNSKYFQGLVKTAWRRASPPDPATLRGMFIKAQWGLTSDAAQALAQMSARGANGDPQLALLVRERQDLVAEWQSRDAARMAALSQPPEKRNKEGEATNTARLTAVETRIGEIDVELRSKFPDYSALASPAPAGVEEVQKALHSDEALILTFETDERWKPLPEETFLWVVTKTDVRWVKSDLGTASLQREVAALRCGLDLAAWSEGPNCSKLLGVSLTADDLKPGKPLPFDLARAHALYKALFGEVEDVIKRKDLLIVPSGPLTRLPLQVLVTQAPDSNVSGPQALRKAQWLIRDHAITVLPSVSALIALRERAMASRATRSMIAFGNPVVEGDESHTSNVPFLLLSREAVHYRQNCALPLSDGEKRLYGGLGTLGATNLGPISTAEQIRRADPIPAMGYLLCEMAHEPGFEDSRVLLANEATKTNLMALNRTGELAKYRRPSAYLPVEPSPTSTNGAQ